MSLVRFGLMGCGRAASFHLSANRNNTKLKFVAAFDPDEKNLRKLARRSQLEPYQDFDKFLRSDIDAVLINVPHYLHSPLTIAAAEAGKHVLCEKPMANSLEECDGMIAAAKKAGVKLMIAENHRLLPAHQYIKDGGRTRFGRRRVSRPLLRGGF